MYAALPAFVSSTFLGYGLYVLVTKGVTRVSASFFLLCVTTFAWQGTWVFLFQAAHPDVAQLLARLGYLFILFLPTTFYHFIAEVTERRQERPLLLASYGMSLVLAVLLLSTDQVVSGYYTYFFGEYPKAGPLHPLHLVQTLLVALRSAWILAEERQNAAAERRKRYNLCLVAVLLYSLAGVDYAVNYGITFYPPGVVFVAGSLGILAVSVVRYDLMHPYSLAATVAHEVRTPLATIRMQAQELARAWPQLLQGYRLAVEHGLCEDRLRPGQLERVSSLVGAITREVDGTSTVIDMALASVTLERLDRSTFAPHGIADCVQAALERFPFQGEERGCVQVRGIDAGWRFVGSDTLLVYVLFNLLKNALHALRAHGGGRIDITGATEGQYHVIRFRDTGPGIPADVMPRIFDPFFSTKAHGSGSGLGLAFCRRVLETFGGRIDCESVPAVHTTFTLRLPRFTAMADTRLRTSTAG
ncbi:ATP-binding protein [Cupriavidus necator]|uniref:sensor histidine kinase n=1 Tax=Cupriavidus necator TaxID=106590 RepID=UPI00339D6418